MKSLLTLFAVLALLDLAYRIPYRQTPWYHWWRTAHASLVLAALYLWSWGWSGLL